MQLHAVLVPPPDVVEHAMAAARALVESVEPTAVPAPGLLARLRGRTVPGPATSLVSLPESAVILRLAKFGNVTGEDAAGLAELLATAAATWPATAVRVESLAVAEAPSYTVIARLGGGVDALRDIYRGIHEAAARQRFFLDRRSFSPELELGALDVPEGAPVPLLDATTHRGPDWTPQHVSLVSAQRSAAGATYAEVARLPLAPS